MEGKLFCTGGGCTAKLGPKALHKVLSLLPKGPADPDLLVGFESSDDAAVYRVSDDCAVVQTLDFFPPMIEDPYLFGQIAAANALSDVYAMGGDVRTALNIVCFPQDGDLNQLGEILRGGAEKVIEAGGTLAGGHSINDTGVKYGLSVTGTVNPSRIWKNNTAREDDLLILTKPLGTGLICSAARVGLARPGELEGAVKSMSTLNRTASEVARRYDIHACTDVTGFGLIGHLLEMTDHRLEATVVTEKLPVLPGAVRAAEDYCLTAAAQRNRNAAGNRVYFDYSVDFAFQELLFDPQTGGGLLFAVSRREAQSLLSDLQCARVPARIIGSLRSIDYSDYEVHVIE